MLWTLIVVLLVLWALGLAFKVAAGAIHILLVVAVILFLVNVISGRRTSVSVLEVELRSLEVETQRNRRAPQLPA